MSAAGERVPMEFIGKARALRSRIEAENDRALIVVETIRESVMARKSNIPRPDALTDLERNWRQRVPAEFRSRLSIERKKKELHLVDVRLQSSTCYKAAWGDVEPGISLTALTVNIAPHVGEFRNLSLALFSLHAVARRFQRALNVDEGAIVADLFAMEGLRDGIPAGVSFTLPRPEGWWAGTVHSWHKGPVARVSTWLVDQ